MLGMWERLEVDTKYGQKCGVRVQRASGSSATVEGFGAQNSNNVIARLKLCNIIYNINGRARQNYDTLSRNTTVSCFAILYIGFPTRHLHHFNG